MRSHSIQEIVTNENCEIRVDMQIPTGMQIQANYPDIFVLDKKRREIILIKVGITSQDRLVTVETEKMHKYNCK
ncbi:hypothetical protein PAEPH01_0683 [Pancytospora epiphaga]|nr:hypothetical protein PAEPH01_0683 [Pancytospora epiphaga]